MEEREKDKDECERHYKRGKERIMNRLDLRGKKESAEFTLRF